MASTRKILIRCILFLLPMLACSLPDVAQPTAVGDQTATATAAPPPAPDPRGLFGPPDVAFPFVWGTFVDRNYILASDINSGLWVFQVR